MAESLNVPVVLVHGWGGNFVDTWKKPGIDALLEDVGRRVVGVDLLGHGTADKPHEPAAYAQLGQWFINQLPTDSPQVDVVGFSLGAMTVLDALMIDPARFRKVVLAGIGNSVIDPTSTGRNDRIVDALEGRSSPDDTFAQMFVQYATQPGNDREALTAIMKRPAQPPLDPQKCANITQPVLVVIGDKDFMFPADQLVAAFPHGSLCVLKNTDHFATTESFSFIDALLDFLTEQ